LSDPSDVDRNDVQEDRDRSDPEMPFGKLGAVELGLIQTGQEPVDHPEGHESIPSKGSGMDVGDGPIGVVRQGIDALDRKHGAFERRHPIKRDPDNKKLEHRIGRDFVPSTSEGQKSIDHSTPGGHPQHQTKEHPEGASPLG